MRRKPNPRTPHLRHCPDCVRRCTTARLRLASRALRPAPPCGHAFMSVGSKLRHLDRDSSALAPISDPITTTPILPQPSTRFSAYPYFLQQYVDGECSLVLYGFSLEPGDDVLRGVNVLGDFRLVPAPERIVVGSVALVLHVDEQGCKGPNLRREVPDGRPSTLRPGVPMFQRPVGLSPRRLAPTRAGPAHERVRAASREAMKQGVVGGAYRPAEIRLQGCAFAGFERASSGRDEVTRGQGVGPIRIS